MIDLYEFQGEDSKKLASVDGGLDGSEMGTGKTYKAGRVVELVAGSHGRTLWVGPLPTLRSSRDKLVEMGVDMPMMIVDVKNRDRSWNRYINGEPGIYFLHWEGVRLLAEDLALTTWDAIIADECHRAQNRKTGHTKALKKIRKVGYKLGMSGTPITGSNDKYWSILSWLYPKDYRSYWKFFERYVNYHVEFGAGTAYKVIDGPKNVEELLQAVDPFYVRHMKTEQCCELHPNGVMPWMPDKYFSQYPVELGHEQRRAYDGMKKDMIAWVGAHGDEPLPAPIAIAQHTRMNQFACAYATVSQAGDVHLAEPSCKLDAVMQILEDNPTEQIVVWSQFKQLIKLLAVRLDAAKISHVLYTGDNASTRHLGVKRFAEGKARVFAGTISAGGVGVDGLQNACSTMVFLDRQFPTTINIQAEDRLWRDGQANAVHVIDVVATDTHDLGRHAKLASSWADIKRVLGPSRNL